MYTLSITRITLYLKEVKFSLYTKKQCLEASVNHLLGLLSLKGTRSSSNKGRRLISKKQISYLRKTCIDI